MTIIKYKFVINVSTVIISLILYLNLKLNELQKSSQIIVANSISCTCVYFFLIELCLIYASSKIISGMTISINKKDI